jgi:outer membrane lipoprotein-sorting protein
MSPRDEAQRAALRRVAHSRPAPVRGGRSGIGWQPAVLTLSVVALASCAPRPPLLPTGPGTPYPDYAAAYAEATARCRAVKTITLSMGLSGKAGSTRLRGTIQAGFAAPAKARLEGIPPFGKPVFVLVADDEHGTLVLSRDDRVLRDAPPDQIVEALAGVALGADALRTIVSGCGFGDAVPSAGSELHANGSDWVLLALRDGAGYLRRDGGAWRLAAAVRGPLTVHYGGFVDGRPSSIEIRSASAGRTISDIRLRLSDVDTNVTLDPRAFIADLPTHPIPLSLEELRRAGPLGGS